VASCSAGQCSIVCNQGFQDCDMDGGNGCEANLQSDPKNCNGCGNVCPMNLPGCAMGQCVACGNDCWGNTGCLTANGHCIQFTCRSGSAGGNFCNGCKGWREVSYDQWMNQGYCKDVIAKYRSVEGTATKCGAQNLSCCGNSGACAGFDNAWHFWDGANNHYVGPCLGCANDATCNFWDGVDNSGYSRISICER
jgi:hypothetical protein